MTLSSLKGWSLGGLFQLVLSMFLHRARRNRVSDLTPANKKGLSFDGLAIVTANRLSDGSVIYRSSIVRWTAQLQYAAIATSLDEANGLLAAAQLDSVDVVGPYITQVVVNDGLIELAILNEQIRSLGLTLDLPLSFGI